MALLELGALPRVQIIDGYIVFLRTNAKNIKHTCAALVNVTIISLRHHATYYAIYTNVIINKVKACFDNSLLEINLDKSKYIYFSINHENIDPRHKTLVSSSNNHNASNTNSTALQSVNKLKWDHHTYASTNTIRKLFFYIFNNVKNIFNTQIKRLIYISLVQSVFNCGIAVWGQAYDSYTVSLKSTVNSLIKFLLDNPKYYQ